MSVDIVKFKTVEHKNGKKFRYLLWDYYGQYDKSAEDKPRENFKLDGILIHRSDAELSTHAAITSFGTYVYNKLDETIYVIRHEDMADALFAKLKGEFEFTKKNQYVSVRVADKVVRDMSKKEMKKNAKLIGL